MNDKLRFLLLQVRDSDDPMRGQEVECFVRALRCDRSQVEAWDLLAGAPGARDLARADAVLLGGSGRYPPTSTDAWTEPVLETLREIHGRAKPTFASCWGFQAMARALGGKVLHDLTLAELGTHQLRLTEAGKGDPIFAPLGEVFMAQMGHEYRVAELPPGAVLLASTSLVENQAYRFEGLPIWCTQFHPELNRSDLLERVATYPEYIYRIAKMPPERFNELIVDTPETEALLVRFARHVFDGR